MDTTWLSWFGFNLFIIILLGVDLFFFQKNARTIAFKESVKWSIGWIALAMLFNLYIYFSRGPEDALNFFTGYLIEKSLSIDNLFVFLLIFKYFKTPEASMRKALFWGVFAAIVLRALFIWLGISLITEFHWVIYLFGLFLIYAGIKFCIEKDAEINPENNLLIRLFRNFIPVTKEYHDNRFFIVKNQQTFATPLLLVVIALETADLLFAIDSIPAVMAITLDPFIVYTSNIFAILGLRALFFVISHTMNLIEYLHYGLSAILIFVGTKMLLSGIYPISSLVSLLIIVSILIVTIGASLYKKKKTK